MKLTFFGSISRGGGISSFPIPEKEDRKEFFSGYIRRKAKFGVQAPGEA